MPVVLRTPEARELWLQGDGAAAVHKLCKPYAAPDLVWHPVTRAMNVPAFQGPVTELKRPPKESFFQPRRAKPKAAAAGAAAQQDAQQEGGGRRAEEQAEAAAARGAVNSDEQQPAVRHKQEGATPKPRAAGVKRAATPGNSKPGKKVQSSPITSFFSPAKT